LKNEFCFLQSSLFLLQLSNLSQRTIESSPESEQAANEAEMNSKAIQATEVKERECLIVAALKANRHFRSRAEHLNAGIKRPMTRSICRKASALCQTSEIRRARVAARVKINRNRIWSRIFKSFVWAGRRQSFQ
jgi:hypothetical protein